MKKNIVYIKQPLWARFLNKFSFNSTQFSEIELDQDTWYEGEGDFIWSYPEAKIELKNSESLSLVTKCPVGREVIFKSKYFVFKKFLKKDKVYTFIIDTTNVDELFISTTPYLPPKDNRELGLCFFNITDKL